ncbi:MAG TPA: tyrosine-type recombinase/integrase [Candidatus Wunengus sp. YC60]|uniref:tyrosine-type recombinase/integrase n=1 Tax=Candidatus Wunengus sp. YC60 TaxID=3367697 RepID=UPI0040282FEB
MAVRWKKYFPEQCRDDKGQNINCDGKRGDYCPVNLPVKDTGEVKRCGRWLVELFDDRKRWVSVSFRDIRSRKDAMKRLMVLIGDRERGKLQLPRKKQIPTLAVYSKTYLSLCEGANGNTLAMKQRAINALVKFLGDYPLDKITPFLIERYRIDRKSSGVKDSSINIDVDVLSHVFITAIKAGIIDKNPGKEVKRLKITQTKDRILSGDEIALLLDKLQGKDRLMVLVGLFTGLRLGGVLGLSWHDIDFTRKIITSSHKTGKLVLIPMSDYLSRELLQWKEVNPSNDRVFETREIINAVVSEYSSHFSQLFKGLGILDFTFHNLRHTFASLLQGELGIGAVVVQGMTGHSSLGMLQKYSHTGIDAKTRAIQTLTDHVLSRKPETSFAIAQ